MRSPRGGVLVVTDPWHGPPGHHPAAGPKLGSVPCLRGRVCVLHKLYLTAGEPGVTVKRLKFARAKGTQYPSSPDKTEDG